MNDESIMPFGKHKGEKLANVPAKYLLWLYDTGCNSGTSHEELKAYIEDNMDVLKQEVKE